MVNKELTIPCDFHSDDPKNLPGKYFHGALLKKEIEGREPGPVTFHVNYPSAGNFVFFLETVSDTGILKISLDHKKLKTFKFMTGPNGKCPWVESRSMGNGIFQCDYNKEYSVKIPAGKHDVSVQNMGTDWLSIGYFVFSGYSPKIMFREYEDWKKYKTTLAQIDKRLKKYRERAEKLYSKQSGDINYDLLPTLKLQIENFEQLTKKHASVDFNLMRTEKELKEIFEYAESNKDYFKLKRGRIKAGYLSEIDSTYQPYDILIPQSYSPAKKYALVLLLHGYQNEIHKYSELVKDDKNSDLDSLSVIKAALYGRRNHYYLGAAEEDVLAVMNIVQSKYSIDPDKIYLTGSSMGGYGTWFIGLNYPDLFAAISPVCPPSIFSGIKFLNTISPIEYISNAQHLPARIYHGAADSTVNVNNSRRMAGRLKEMNYEYVYTEYPGVGHDSWNKADADTDRLPWLLKHTRNLYPDSVRHKAFYLRYGKAYWLQITRKRDWNKFSEIEGNITGRNSVNIHTDNIASFSVDLRHPALNIKEPVRVIIDRDSILLNNPSESAEFYLSKDSTWVMGVPKITGLQKKHELEGPFNAVETGPFLFVYGTGNAQKAGMLKKIGTMMQNGCAVSDMDIKLVPDTLVIQNKLAEKNNLYLIGSPDENIYLREIISGLPVSFGKDSLEFNGKYNRMETGIKLIYPNPKQPDKYLIVDTYPELLPDIDQIVDFPAADYLIYSLKGGKFEILKDEFFGPDWQVVK